MTYPGKKKKTPVVRNEENAQEKRREKEGGTRKKTRETMGNKKKSNYDWSLVRVTKRRGGNLCKGIGRTRAVAREKGDAKRKPH